jgi:trk system potassium uptake protein TrkA
MKQFAIIGLSYFGKNVLDEFLALDADVLIIDKDRSVIDQYKDSPVSAVVLDVLNEENLGRVLPKTIDAVVIDLGAKIEASILATSYCRKLGISRIIVKAETEEHGEILELVGATKIVFPNREAAKRITPLLLSSAVLNYLPVSGKLAIAELAVPDRFIGLSLLQVNLRKKFGLNLISVKNGPDGEYELSSPEYLFRPADVALVSGTEESLESFASMLAKEQAKKSRTADGGFMRIFGRRKGKGA